MTGMQILDVSVAVDAAEEALYKNEPGFFDSIRSRACRALASKIIQDASLHRRVGLDATLRHVQHRWTIGVQTNLSEIESRLSDMEKARAEGRAEAAKIVYAAAARYRNSHSDGPCKWVIASALEDAAAKI